MREVLVNAGEISDIFFAIENYPNNNLAKIFRGHASSRWKLIPSLYRNKIEFSSAYNYCSSYDSSENVMIEKFFQEGFPYLSNMNRGYFNDRVVAQHFGVPTRLLDWTRDPLVAVFFAVEDERNEEDAAIYMMFPPSFLLANRPGPVIPYNILGVEPTIIDQRVQAQKSLFTIQRYGQVDKDYVPLDDRLDMFKSADAKLGIFPDPVRFLIPARYKAALRNALYHIGVHRKNLFPGLDQVGAAIAREARGQTRAI